MTKSIVEFGVIPEDHWRQPEWIDETKAAAARDRMVATNVKYGGTWRLSFSRFLVNEHWGHL
jgi:alpha 1,2-mannosyltransferase